MITYGKLLIDQEHIQFVVGVLKDGVQTQNSAIQTFEEVVTVLNGSRAMLIVADGHTVAKPCDRLYRLRQCKVVAEGLLTVILPTKGITSSTGLI